VPKGTRRPGSSHGPRLRLLLGGLAALALSGCTLQPASDRAHDIQWSYQVTFVFAAIIFVVVAGLIVYSAIRFRAKRGDTTLPKQVHGSTRLEIAWIAVPSAIVLVLFIVSATALAKVDAPAPRPMVVNVEGFQWQWKFTYPEFTDRSGKPLAISGQSGTPGDGTYGKPTLALELNRGVHFNLVSNDVIHSFYIPNFLFKRDVVPGHPNEFDLTPDRAGTFSGKCAELCGLRHSTMLFIVKVLPHDQFEQWAQDAIKVQQHQTWVKANQCLTASNGAVTVAAKNIAFDTSCIEVPAAAPTDLVFDNQDPGVPHNIEVYTNPSATTRLAGATGASDVITGVAKTTYTIGGLKPGTYFFQCDIHPAQMTGTFKVTG
jgi:cytochrome c oxidase subunit 2